MENKKQTYEKIAELLLGKFDQNSVPVETVFEQQLHFDYITKFIRHFRISSSFDIQKPWLLYWAVNSLAVINQINLLTLPDRRHFGEYLLSFQVETGGFAGGQGYQANLISTYATILSIALLDVPELNNRINVNGIENFILNCRGTVQGSYQIHLEGETDLRCAFVAVLLSKMLNISNPKITEGVALYIAMCQTFEGGIAPVPGVEAHGGYTFCGIAAMALLGELESLNLKKMLFWLINNQTQFGGFAGRTNKLIDSCYSFWQASSFHIIQEYFESKEDPRLDTLLYDNQRMQVYLLECCQGEGGGMRDKPGKSEDIYHTMYSLSGLALSSQTQSGSDHKIYDWENLTLEDMDPIYNIPRIKANKFMIYFRDSFTPPIN